MSFTSFVKKAAPWLTTVASAIFPGAAPILGVASGLLSKGLGTTVKADTDSITNAITMAAASPDQLATLKKIDDDFAVQMRQLGIQEAQELEEILAQDRASARNLQIQTRSSMPAMLAWAAVITLLLCIYLLAFRPLPADGKDAILILLGAVVASYKDVYGYFFGSSAGSAQKTELLANGNGNGNSH